MHTSEVIDLVIFFGAFLAGSVLIHRLTKRFSFPYTITVFVVGLILQNIHTVLPFGIHFDLSPEVIFYILLPFLLFESAMHIKFHQFRLQFKTISFISTFGLLFSVFTIGMILPLLTGLPMSASFLFGAVISATDPVAVLALFKTLRVPKRLALLVDGESMFNDGTGVIVFKLVSTFVLAGTAISTREVFSSFGNFLYVFFGAMALGIFLGYVTSWLISNFEEDKIAQTTLTVALALGSFILAEHYLHVSGVITTVLAGITLGNFGLIHLSNKVRDFNEEMWDYVSFLSNSVVFFFIGFVFHLTPFLKNPLFYLSAVLVVLLGRIATTYVSYLFSNTLPIFKDEPNVPLRWQHLINWGGLRGTIPIILVFTIPTTYQYYNEMVNLTLASVLFTLAINGTTCAWFLKKLQLHLPTKDERLIEQQISIFKDQDKKQKLEKLEQNEFDEKIIDAEEKELMAREKSKLKQLLAIAEPDTFEKSLKRYALSVERRKLLELLSEDSIDQAAFFEFDTELDLQEDALDFGNERVRYLNAEGKIDNSKSYRKRLFAARRRAANYPIVSKILGVTEEELILNRYQILKARLITSEEVFEYFDKVKQLIKQPKLIKKVNEVIAIHNNYVKRNNEYIKEIEQKYPKLVLKYQEEFIDRVLESN